MLLSSALCMEAITYIGLSFVSSINRREGTGLDTVLRDNEFRNINYYVTFRTELYVYGLGGGVD